jgi:hypothetical protein
MGSKAISNQSQFMSFGVNSQSQKEQKRVNSINQKESRRVEYFDTGINNWLLLIYAVDPF